MAISIPNTNSDDNIEDTDLVLTFRPGERSDASAGYGLRAQSFSELMPEYRLYNTTLTATTGTDASWVIQWDSGPLDTPSPVRVDWYSKWTQAGQGADTSWALHTWGVVFMPTIGNNVGGWYHVHLPGSADSNRFGHTHRNSDGNVRVGSTVVDGANGWNMDYNTSTSTLRLSQRGTPPFGLYNAQTLAAAITV